MVASSLILLRKRSILPSPGTLGCLAAAMLALSGCADTRITLEQLQALEAEVADVEPVQLETVDLALTEIRLYTVGVNDILNITFTGLGEQFSKNELVVRVHDDGTIMLPMVGKLKVQGLDLKGVEKMLYEAHVPAFVKDMSVFVELGGSESTTVVVVGASGDNGLVRLPGNERNVLYALSQGVAFGAGGSGRVHVKPIRSARPEATYDLTKINDVRRVLLAPPLESGDMIVIEPADPDAIYVTGLVNTPGPVVLPPNSELSLVRALAAAGGLRDFLNPNEATLWRKLPDGRQVRVKLSLWDVMSGKTRDIALHSGDVLDVPHTADTRILEWFAANVRLGPFGVTSIYDPMADRRARTLSNNNSNFIQQAFLQTMSAGLTNRLITPAQVP